MSTIQERFEEKFTKTDGCWEWTAGKGSDGYGRFRLDGRARLAHRVAYQLYVGAIPKGLFVCHRCDNPSCVRPDHLFLGTNADNVHDCENKGRGMHPSGEKHGQAKLTKVQVIESRARYSAGERQADLAREFGVTRSAIYDIVHHHNWSHV